MLIAGNTRLYAGVTQITPEAVVDDGLLDVRVYMGRGRVDLIRFALQTLFRRHRGSGRVVYRQVRELHMDWDAPLPMQLDGDPCGDSPKHVKAVPASSGWRFPLASRAPFHRDGRSVTNRRSEPASTSNSAAWRGIQGKPVPISAGDEDLLRACHRG
jgi:hypothetical protein